MEQREALLEGALRSIQEKGYAATTARDIVAAAPGTHLAAIGYHYGSKERLLDEALTAGCQRWGAELLKIAIAEPDAAPAERLQRIAQEIPATFEQNRGLVLAFVEALSRSARSDALRETVADRCRAGREMAAAVVRAAADDLPDGAPEITETDVRVSATIIVAIFDGLLIQWSAEPEQTPTGDQLLETAMRFLPVAAQLLPANRA